jgi:hypothetical protein
MASSLFYSSDPTLILVHCIVLYICWKSDDEMNRPNQNIVVVAWSKIGVFTSGKMFFAAKREHIPSQVPYLSLSCQPLSLTVDVTYTKHMHQGCFLLVDGFLLPLKLDVKFL